jgi:single-strand DNA-binding protein
MSDAHDIPHENSVHLRGLLADEVRTRTLPSGDELCIFRLTVRRPAASARGRTKVDSIDCASASKSVRRAALHAQPGDVVEVSGRLQRRFWRGPAGLASRYEVEASSFKRQPINARRARRQTQSSS